MTKQIKIEELIPFMRKGWVAMDKDGDWNYFTTVPYKDKDLEMWDVDPDSITDETEVEVLSTIFNIAPAKDWTKSLIHIKGEKQNDR